MKFPKNVRVPLVVVALFSVAAWTLAQEADKQKLIEIEKVFAAHPNAGPEAAAATKQYLFDGTLIQLTGQGQVGTLPKARVVELNTTPNPADPDVKSIQTLSDFHIEFYGETALVAYKDVNTDTGHKDPALNTTDHFGCLDTFVKREGKWVLVANACAPSQPLPRAEWNAAKKAMEEMPKDVKDAYH
jgi:hypothetical protein